MSSYQNENSGYYSEKQAIPHFLFISFLYFLEFYEFYFKLQYYKYCKLVN